MTEQELSAVAKYIDQLRSAGDIIVGFVVLTPEGVTLSSYPAKTQDEVHLYTEAIKAFMEDNYMEIDRHEVIQIKAPNIFKPKSN